MDNENSATLQLVFKECPDANAITAHLYSPLGAELVLGTFSKALADHDKSIFDAWVKGMEGVVDALCEKMIGQIPKHHPLITRTAQ